MKDPKQPPDPYDILGITPSATAEQIQTAYLSALGGGGDPQRLFDAKREAQRLLAESVLDRHTTMANELPSFGIDQKRFFDAWRGELVASMTLVDILPQGDLYYYDQTCILWVIVGSHSLLIAYSFCESPEEIREKVRRWDDVLHDYEAAEPFRAQSGAPVYAAAEDPEGRGLRVAWFQPGDWCALATFLKRPLPKRRTQLPKRWPESYRSRIAELAERPIETEERGKR